MNDLHLLKIYLKHFFFNPKEMILILPNIFSYIFFLSFVVFSFLTMKDKGFLFFVLMSSIAFLYSAIIGSMFMVFVKNDNYRKDLIELEK